MRLEKNKMYTHIELGDVHILDFIPYGNTGCNKIVYTKGLIGKIEYMERTDIQVKEQFREKSDAPVSEKQQVVIVEETNQLKDTTEEMRSTLFEVIRGLKDGSIKPETAKAINETSQTIINSIKVELDYVKITGRNGHKPKLIQ